MGNTVYTAVVVEDEVTGELYITFPPDVLNDLNWDEQTELEWKQIDDTHWSIQKVKQSK